MAYTTIDNPELYFQTKVYAGNSSNSHAITLDGDEDMSPNFVWIKSQSSNSSRLTDSVRGATKVLYTDLNYAEVTDADTIQSFDSDGFTLDDDTDTNGDTQNFTAWCWKESADAGFDLVSYTGNATNRTISHSLSAAPKVVIIKDRSTTGEWVFGHAGLGFTKFIEMNSHGAAQTVTSRFNDTAPTSSVFTVGTANDTNENTDSFIAYLWAEKQGYSKFGTFVGNASTNGTMVWTGFRPAYVLFKKTTGSAANWQVWDNKRDPENSVNNSSLPDNVAADQTDQEIDFLSNGFKIKTVGHHVNGDGITFVYMAFAEAPFVNSKGVPCNAR